MLWRDSFVLRPCLTVIIFSSTAIRAPLQWLRALHTQKCPFPCQEGEGELHNLSEFTDHARRRTLESGADQPRGALG